MVCPRQESDRYAQCRRAAAMPQLLREKEWAPSEKLLQIIWQHQRLQRDHLTTTQGESIVVLHPGFRNKESGPDFHNAIIVVGSHAAVRGDIEIDLNAGGWHDHGHDRNPNYGRVVLHVVWDTQTPARQPTLCLKDKLDSALEELSAWAESEPEDLFPEQLRGRCCQPLKHLNAEALRELIQEAGLYRLESKGRRLEARARQVGWHQSLWEGLFRALGYQHNSWPMQRLGEIHHHLARLSSNLESCQAVLFGTAHLLPTRPELLPGAAAAYARGLWDYWWRVRHAVEKWALPGLTWRFSGIRPANRPERRLALAAHWMRAPDLPRFVERWGAIAQPNRSSRQDLLELLQGGPDPFWTRHWSWRSLPAPKARPLLGAARLGELAVNVVLPWLWIRSREGHRAEYQNRIEQIFLAWPATGTTAVTRLAQQRLLGGRRPPFALGAAALQGLLQIVRDFCLPSGPLCEGCSFPEHVELWKPGRHLANQGQPPH